MMCGTFLSWDPSQLWELYFLLFFCLNKLLQKIKKRMWKIAANPRKRRVKDTHYRQTKQYVWKQEACSNTVCLGSSVWLVPDVSDYVMRRSEDTDALILSIRMESWEPGMVVHAYNPSTQQLRQEDGQVEASLGDIVTACLKKKLIYWNENKNIVGAKIRQYLVQAIYKLWRTSQTPVITVALSIVTLHQARDCCP
jgi:hypothetical protein